MFAVTNSNQKIGQKSQNYLFTVNNCEQKGDNVIILEGTKVKIDCLHLVTAKKRDFHFFVLSNIITLSPF